MCQGCLMKIEFMRIENWRSFYGKNEIVFSVDPEKNVTLVRAENGVGKTSLLAALNWCLFGMLPNEEDFQNPKILVNSYAQINESAKQTKIELEFEHHGKVYKASRTYDQAQERTNALRLVEIKDGVETPLSSGVNVDRFVNSVLPKEMAPHFFFFGEATSRYADESGAESFGAAVKNILGATAAGIALKDLEKAFKDYQREASDNSSDEAIGIQTQIDEIESKKADLEDALSDAQREEKASEEMVDKIGKQLLGSQQVKKDQQRRDRLTSEVKQLNAQLEKEIFETQSWFNKYGTALLSRNFISDVQELLEKEDTKKKIPGPFNEMFVKDVLEDELCICGRPIKHGSIEEKNVKALLDTASDETMINRIMSTNVALGRLNEKASNGWQSLERSRSAQARITEKISIAEAELAEISEALKNNDIADIAKKENARISAKSKARTAVERQTTISNILHENERRIQRLRRDQERLVAESLAARRYVKRAQLAGALSSRLNARLGEEELYARVEIKRKIDQIISAFMRKKLTVEIDQNYRVSVKDENRNLAANSTGEKQMLGLAFTGAIADFARSRQHEEVDILLSGTEAPLVVDSPFGHLDSQYRRGVADFLPQMAQQVILLLSSSQATPEVLEELEDKIGSQYVLARYEKAASDGRASEEVEINGKVKSLTQYGQEFTGTLIEEVN